MSSPYSGKFSYDRQRVIYGFVINRKNGKHYCFNRDFLVLPVELPPETLVQLESIAQGLTQSPKSGHGRFKLPDIGEEKDCETVFLFNDGTAPKWSLKKENYDKSIYERAY